MQHVPDCGRRKSLRDVADPWTATEVDGPTARALVKLLVTRADPVTGVAVLMRSLSASIHVSRHHFHCVSTRVSRRHLVNLPFCSSYGRKPLVLTIKGDINFRPVGFL